MAREYTVAVFLVNYALTLGGQAGVSKDSVCAAVGIPLAFLSDPHGKLPYAKYRALLAEIARLAGNESFWLQKVKQFEMSLDNPTWYWYYNATNLREAARRYERLYMIFSRVAFPAHLEIEAEFCIRATPRAPDIKLSTHNVDLMLSAWWDSTMLFTGPSLKLQCVRLTNGDKARIAAYEKFFKAPAIVNQPFNELVFDSSALALPNARREAEPNLDAMLEKLIKPLLAGASGEASIQESTFEAIQRQLHHGIPKQGDIAKTLGLSVRSFQRKLAEVDRTFSEMLQDTRRELAGQYLMQPELSITDVAQLLGYSEASSMSKAFRKWYQMTPREYRAQKLP